MLALAHALGRRCLRVVVSTTTKIWPVEDVPTVLVGEAEPNAEQLRQVAQGAATVIARARSPEGKLVGLDPFNICALRTEGVGDVWLVEADGSSGRPLKIHASHEPVIPPCATHVLILMGVDAVGRPAGETVHRAGDFWAWRGRGTRDAVTEEDVLALFLRAAREVPAGAAKIYLLNRLDAKGAQEAACRIQDRLLTACPGAAVFLTVRGNVISSPRETPG
jgi:probable selenium-dependent hydroxylase accessory protein YqeC